MKSRPQLLTIEPLEDRTLMATCHVIRLSDTGGGNGSNGDLRYCIHKVNAEPGPDVIDIGVTGNIGLNQPLPALASDIDIQGPGKDKLTVRRSGGATFRIINILAGAEVSISGLTITNGRSNMGGGILNLGRLNLNEVVVIGNAAGAPGNAYGGGIYNGQDASLTLKASIVARNRAAQSPCTAGAGEGGEEERSHLSPHGGGIFNAGLLIVVDSSIHGNMVIGCEDQPRGGGIYSQHIALIFSSTISANQSVHKYKAVGGGVYGTKRLSIFNSTISGNVANGGAGGFGGGIVGGDMTISHSTITQNVADHNAGILAGRATLRNTILGGNSTEEFPGYINEEGPNLIGGNPLLAPLADNGGPALTHAPLPGSPAIDAGGDGPGAPEFDQRGPGFPRIVNGTIDIGAFEVQSTVTPTKYGRASVLALATSDALKGRDITAQGNALGNEAMFASALKGRDHRTAEYGVSVAPLQGLVHRATFQPRALPWADLFRPVGAEGDLEIFS